MKYLINIYLVLFLACLLSACGKEEVKVTETRLVPVPVPGLTFEEDVQALLDDENDYRTGLGQAALSEGLSCALSTFTSGDRIQATADGHQTLTGLSQVATYSYEGLFNQPDSPISDGMNVLPEPLKSLYKNMYLLRCQGQVVVTETNYHQFVLTSDDASLLYIDGVKVIDNDNGHGTTSVVGIRYLRRGVHTFRVDYAQTGGGNQSLVLTMNGSSINPVLYAH